MGIGVAFVFIADVDETNLDLIRGHTLGAGGNGDHAQHQAQNEQQASELLHENHPPDNAIVGIVTGV